MPRAQIKDENTYRKLREKGESKEKSARIANAAAGSSKSSVGRKGGESPSYADWSKQDLVKRAREIGIKGRSTTKRERFSAPAAAAAFGRPRQPSPSANSAVSCCTG